MRFLEIRNANFVDRFLRFLTDVPYVILGAVNSFLIIYFNHIENKS